MEYEILKLLSSNARYTADDIATMLGADVKEVENTIKKLENFASIKNRTPVCRSNANIRKKVLPNIILDNFFIQHTFLI